MSAAYGLPWSVFGDKLSLLTHSRSSTDCLTPEGVPLSWANHEASLEVTSLVHMDLTAVTVAVIAGAGSGFLSALVTPFAQRRSQQSHDRTQARRELIAKGRILVQKADAEGWSPVEISQAVDWLALRAHLPRELVEHYTPRPRTHYVSGDSARHSDLADAIDQLERAWRLV